MAPALPGASVISTVGISGGFTGFSGPASIDHPIGAELYTTYVNGEVFAPDPSSPPSTLGLGSVTFSQPLDRVVFYTTHTTEPGGDATTDLLNTIEFVPSRDVPVTIGDEFLLGTFHVTNGTYWAGRGNPMIGFSLTTESDEAALHGHQFAGTLEFIQSPNASNLTPEERADYFFFKNRPDLGSMRILEQSDVPEGEPVSGSIDLYGRIGSLVPTRFANPQGAVYFDINTPPQPPRPVADSGSAGVLCSLALAALVIGQRLVRARHGAPRAADQSA